MKVHQLFHDVLCCDRCDAADSHVLRSLEHPPQPGYVGARYEETRLMLVGQNPGMPPTRLREPDAQYIAALIELRKRADAETFAATMREIEQYAPRWPINDLYFPLRECELALDQVAFCNIVRCRTEGNTRPDARAVGNCVSGHFDVWLAELKPTFVVFLGKWAADRGAASVTRLGIPFATINRDRSQTKTARSEDRAKVAKAVREAVG